MVARTLETSVDIPYWDQWDFYTPLFNHASLWRVFAWQHGPHREGIGLVADKFLLEWTHWSARAESLLIVGCFCAAALLAIRLKVKLFGRLSYSDAVIPCMFLMLAHMSAVTGIPNPSYSGFPELLIILYCLAWTLRKAVVRYPAVLVLNFLLIYTGFGFFVGIITLLILAFELRSALRAKAGVILPIVALAFALLSFASFFLDYQRSPAKLVRCIEHPHLLNYPWFVALTFSSFLGIRRSMVLASLVGSVVSICLLWIVGCRGANLWRGREWADCDRVITILGTFSLLFAVAAALGRACLGMPAAAQSYRYVGLLVPGFVAVYFHLCSIPSPRKKVILLMILLIAVVPPALRNHADRDTERGKRAWVTCLLQSQSAQQCQQSSGLVLYPDPARTHLQEKLDYLRSNRLSLYNSGPRASQE